MAKTKRYHSTIIVAHWAMAVAIFMMLGSGIAMEYFDLDKSLKFQMFQWHKSGGVLLLIAVVLRIAARLMTHMPALPKAMKALEIKLAKIGHFALYFLMFAMPLSGWLMVSSSSFGLPTIVFNWFEWPHIPGVQSNKLVHEIAETGHLVLAILLGITLIGHIGAVIKHYALEHINLLPRLWWSSGE